MGRECAALCEAEGIPTLTAVITGVWEDPPVWPLAHVLQVVLALREPFLLQRLAERLAQPLTEAQSAYVEQVYAYESSPVRRLIKGACNLILPESRVWEMISPLSDQEVAALQQRFAHWSAYQKFNQASLAPHTHGHRPFAGDAAAYVQTEVMVSQRCLAQHGLRILPWFVLPMKPKFGAAMNALVGALKQAGFKGMLTSSSGFWNGRDFIVPRLDGSCQLEKVLEVAQSWRA